jgi:hypothetical protein
VEAPNVELDTLPSRRADTFHDKLDLADQFLAGVTRLTGTSSAPNARDAVLRKSTIGELGLDQETKGALVHESTSGVGFGGASQIHRGLGATTPTQKAGVQATRLYG